MFHLKTDVRISLLEKESSTGSTLELLRSHERSMEYIDVTITFSRWCN